jgi:hypothetical protein
VYESEAAEEEVYGSKYERELAEWNDRYGSMESIDEIYGDSQQATDDAVAVAVKYAADNMDLTCVEQYGASAFMPWHEDYEWWGDSTLSGEGSSEYKTLATFVFRRSCSLSLADLFYRYNSLLTLYLPYEKYVSYGYERVVELLIAAYDDMDGDGRKFEKIYNYMTDIEYSEEDRLELIERYISDETKETFGLGHGETRELYVWNQAEGFYYCNSEARWAFSFWGRRHNECEGNPKDICEVLTAIRDLYDDLAPGYDTGDEG